MVLLKTFRAFLGSVLLVFLSGCKLAVLQPHGRIAIAERDLFIDALGLMLLIVVPVIILTIVITWRYKAKNKTAKYEPDWAHSNWLEAACWTPPLIIIAILAVLTWKSSHELDPYKPIVVPGKQPLTVQVVALNWKWLFIMPKQNIASINYLEIPVNTPINFVITADAPMNSFEIPSLAGQIYAMAAMKTQLHITADQVGTYKGLSTNYSGNGFADMTFKIKAVSDDQFDLWVNTVKQLPEKLTSDRYNQLTYNSTNNKVELFSGVKNNLFNDVVMKYMDPSLDKQPINEPAE